jgi:protease-4
MVNDGVYFNSEQALKNKLVDEVGQMGSTNTIAGVFGPCAKLVGPDYVLKTRLPKDNKWGMEPTIAVVYAIGATSMDSGINARRLVKDLACVETNPDVCAVVLRVDSPGGDALASDLVAEAIKKCRLKKPVIISQGYLAASGGYWISMDGDTILTTPLTLTGSIGVISGWVYNKGLKEKLGITTDIVKDGKYADLGFGMPIPFVGHLPDRNLAERELTLMKEGVGSIYKIFVNKVAEARKKKYDYIDSIAQGRVWTGTDAIGNGLADKIGGLDAAIKVAKEKCHIPQGQRVYIDEYPKPALVTIGMFFGASDEASARESEFVNYMKLRLEYNGKPIPLMPAEYMEFKD